MKKSFIAFFIIFMVITVVYQQHYLKTLREESLQISAVSADSEKTIIGEGHDFSIFFFDESGALNAKMLGKKVIYYQEGSFQAQDNLVYETYDSNKAVINTIKTDLALGEFESQSDNSFLLSGNRSLKSLILPEKVVFDFNGNNGTTKNVFIDTINRTITSKEHVESNGPNGKFSADGFFYDIDKKVFKFKSKVRGTYKQNSLPKNEK